jgi:hypothetical protein
MLFYIILACIGAGINGWHKAKANAYLANKHDEEYGSPIMPTKKATPPKTGFCPQCGDQITDGDRFCRKCGGQI